MPLIVNDLPLDFTPRPYQAGLMHDFFKPNPLKRALLTWHRRSGKDKVCWAILLMKALMKKGSYYYVFPTQRQARKALWHGIGSDGIGFLEHIPGRVIVKTNNTEMRIHLINGSLIQLIGAANYNFAMGTNPLGIIYSEYSLQTPMAYTYLMPILVENGGFCIVNGTPRGHNHFYRLHTSVMNVKKWFSSIETVATTVDNKGRAIISPEDIEEARSGGMSHELIKQEFYCDFESALETAYFAKYLAQSREYGRVKNFPIPDSPVFTFWDLGVSDLTTIWFATFSMDKIHLVGYYENSRHGLEHYAEYLEKFKNNNNIIYGGHFGPHDTAVMSLSTGETRVVRARSLGINFVVVPKPKRKIDSIEICRGMFNMFVFHQHNCQTGLDALLQYESKLVGDGGEAGPKHSWASHSADAFLLIGQAYTKGMLPIKRNEPRTSFRINEGAMDAIL